MGKQVIRLYRSEGGGSKIEPLVVETEPQWPGNLATVVQKPDHFGVENTHPCVIHTQEMRTGYTLTRTEKEQHIRLVDGSKIRRQQRRSEWDIR